MRLRTNTPGTWPYSMKYTGTFVLEISDQISPHQSNTMGIAFDKDNKYWTETNMAQPNFRDIIAVCQERVRGK